MNEERNDPVRKQEEDRLLENAENKKEAQALRLIFDALQREPEINLSRNFADKIVDAAVSRQLRKDPSREYVWFGGGILAILISLIVAILKTDFSFDLGFLEGVSSYSGLFIFGCVFITLLHVIDKKWIRPPVNDKAI